MGLVNIEVDEDVVLEKVSKKVSSELLQVFEKFPTVTISQTADRLN